MERNEFLILFLVAVFVVLMLLQFISYRKAKSISSDDRSVYNYKELPAGIRKYWIGTDLFVSLAFISVVANRFSLTFYTGLAGALAAVSGLYALYRCYALKSRRLTLELIVKLVCLVLLCVLAYYTPDIR